MSGHKKWKEIKHKNLLPEGASPTNYNLMMQYYDFDGNLITMKEWGKLLDSPDRIFGRTKVNNHEVSTVWIGIDHGFGGPIKIFETMVFCRKHECAWSHYERRYSTKGEALRGHACMCNDVTGEDLF